MTNIIHRVGSLSALAWRSSTSAAATLTVTLPDGSTVSPTVAGTPPAHTVQFTPTLPGRHQLLWSIAGAETHADIIDVWPTHPRYLVAQADAIDRLRLSNQITAAPDSVSSMPLYIATATAIIEDVTGPLLPVERTTKVSGHYRKRAVVLPYIHVTVTSVTVDDNVLDDTQFKVDEEAGIVYSDYLTEGDVNVEVAFTVGDVEIPPQARLACLEVIAHLWQITRQGLRESGATDETVTTPMGFALPRRAWEMVQSIPRAAGIA